MSRNLAELLGVLSSLPRAYSETDMETPPGRGRSEGPGLSRALASIALAMLILVSAVGAGAGVALASAPGMVGVPDSNVKADVPDHAKEKMPTVDDLRGSVMSSKHAETLEVTISTEARAMGRQVACNGPAAEKNPQCSNPKFALVLSDDVNADGRQIAVPVGAVENSLGYVPPAVYGVHESGDRWTAPVTRQGDLLLFDVPHFSTNVVTFSGEIQLTGSPAVDGAQYSYTVSDLDAVENFTLDVTGSTGYNWDNYSSVESDGGTIPIAVDGTTSPTGPGGSPEITLTGVGSTTWDNYTATKGDGESIPIDVGGNLDPTGPEAGNNPEITLTGIETLTDEDKSGTITGGATAISIGGNSDPIGPSYQPTEPRLSVTAQEGSYSPFSSQTGTESGFGNGDNMEIRMDVGADAILTDFAIEADCTFSCGGGEDFDVFVVEGAPDGSYSGGTQVGTITLSGSTDWTTHTVDISDYRTTGGTVTIELRHVSGDSLYQVRTDNSPSGTWSSFTGTGTTSRAVNASVTTRPGDLTVVASDGTTHNFGTTAINSTTVVDFDLSKDASDLDFQFSGGSVDWYLDMRERTVTKDVGIDLDGDATDEITHSGVLDDGETASYAAPLSTSDSSLDISTDNSDVTVDLVMQEVQKTKDVGIDLDGDASDEITHSGVLDPGETVTYDAPLSLADNALDISTDNSDVDVALAMREVTETTDPSVEVNGNVVSHSGTLADGETVSLNTSTSWVREGTNQINISVTSPGGSAAPGQVGFNYRHEAVDNQSVAYQGEKWSERYNVSKTYSSDRQNATLTVPFDQTVYSIRSLEVRANGGAWDPLTPSEYSLTGTTLTAQLGEISAGDTIEVRAVGSKVSVNNGAITVTDPTPVGESLDSGIRIDDWNNNSYIAVGGTEDAHRVHYLYNETWNGDEHTVIASNGGQQLVLPAAEVGGTARVSSIPVKAEPLTGEVWISVSSPSSTEPTFEVAPGANYGDDVEFTHLAADSGTSYILYSESDGIQLDSAEAGEPAVFEGSDREGTLEIRADSGNSTSTGPVGTGPGGFIGQTTNTVVEAMPVMNPGLIAVLVLAIIGFAVAYTERRTPDGLPVYRRPIVLLAVGVAFVLGIMLLAPDAILGPVRTALSATLPLAGIAGVLLVAYLIYSWRQEKEKRASTPQQVFELVGREK
ncbi:hypothetical protein [Haladaptatus sp. ZSTT2]|uniref:hypothetical protein n=1 Tax=Haladaptatus sp. ZSTT2 TaxID=3120515 RepID=UPI00300F3836